MRSRMIRRRKNQFLVACLAILGFAYLHFGLFPGPLKSYPLQWIENESPYPIEFGRVLYLPIWGTRIDDVYIHLGDGLPPASFKSIRLKTDLLSFIRENKIVINKLFLHQPRKTFITSSLEQFYLQDQSGTDNVNTPTIDWIMPLIAGGTFSSNVYIEDVYISEGELMLLDNLVDRQLLEKILDLHVKINVAESRAVPVQGRFKVKSQKYPIHMNGTFDLINKKYEIDIRGALTTFPLWLDSKLKTMRIQLDGNNPFHLELFNNNEGDHHFRIQSKHPNINVNTGDRSLSGQVELHLNGYLSKNIEYIKLGNGKLQFKEATFNHPFSFMNSIQNMNGSINIDHESVRLENLTGQWDDTDLILQGSIRREAPFATDLKITQQAEDLATWSDLLPDNFSNNLKLDTLKGNIQLKTKIQSPLADLKSSIESVSITLSDAVINPLGFIRPLEDLHGTLNLNREAIQIENLSFKYAQEYFKSHGEFKLKPLDSSQIHLTHPDWSLDAAFLWDQDVTRITLLKLSSGLSRMDLSGDLVYQDVPYLQLDGESMIDLTDFSLIWKGRWPFLESIRPQGTLNGNISIRGPLLEPEDLNVTLKSHLPHLIIFDSLFFGDVSCDLTYDSGKIFMTYGKAQFYEGELRGTGHLNLTDPARPWFQIKTFTHDTNLAYMASNFDFLNDDFAGKLNFDLTLEGYLNDSRSFIGEGNYQIYQGNLWTTHKYRKLGNLAFLSMEGFNDLSFHHADGSFVISDNHIYTDDSIMSSPLINIYIKGAVGFDQSLNLRFKSRFTSNVIHQTDDLGGLAPTVRNIAESRITQYQAMGTLSNPIFEAI